MGMDMDRPLHIPSNFKPFLTSAASENFRSACYKKTFLHAYCIVNFLHRPIVDFLDSSTKRFIGSVTHRRTDRQTQPHSQL